MIFSKVSVVLCLSAILSGLYAEQDYRTPDQYQPETKADPLTLRQAQSSGQYYNRLHYRTLTIR
jgi:hypothetical protein